MRASHTQGVVQYQHVSDYASSNSTISHRIITSAVFAWATGCYNVCLLSIVIGGVPCVFVVT